MSNSQHFIDVKQSEQTRQIECNHGTINLIFYQQKLKLDLSRDSTVHLLNPNMYVISCAYLTFHLTHVTVVLSNMKQQIYWPSHPLLQTVLIMDTISRESIWYNESWLFINFTPTNSNIYSNTFVFYLTVRVYIIYAFSL